MSNTVGMTEEGMLSDQSKVRELVDKIPGAEGWCSENARSTFRAQAVFLLNYGLSVEQIVNILSDLYSATMLELTA